MAVSIVKTEKNGWGALVPYFNSLIFSKYLAATYYASLSSSSSQMFLNHALYFLLLYVPTLSKVILMSEIGYGL